jgi:hypothetical protein
VDACGRTVAAAPVVLDAAAAEAAGEHCNLSTRTTERILDLLYLYALCVGSPTSGGAQVDGIGAMAW